MKVWGHQDLNLFRKKNLLDACEAAIGLRKELKTIDLFLLGIGAIVGAGIFMLTGKGIMELGAAIIFSFILAAIACILSGLAMAEFASMVPISGSYYTYTYLTMGELLAWIIGWSVVLQNLLGASSIAGGFSVFFHQFLALLNIDVLDPRIEEWLKPPALGGIFNVPAAFIVLAVTFLLARGLKESKIANNFMASLKVALVILVILAGLFFIFNKGTVANSCLQIPVDVDFKIIIKRAAVLFFCFTGFDLVASASEETKDPKRMLPRAILYSLFFSTILFIVFSLVTAGIVPIGSLTEQNSNNAVYVAMTITRQSWINFIIQLGLVLGLAAGVLAYMYSLTRLLLCMSRDGLLPRFLSTLHPKTQVPLKTTWIIGIIASLLAGLIDADDLIVLFNVPTLLIISFVSLAIILLRKRQPKLNRPFRCPMVPFLPILSILINIGLLVYLPPVKGISSNMLWMLAGIWTIGGLLIYFLYSYKHSKLNK